MRYIFPIFFYVLFSLSPLGLISQEIPQAIADQIEAFLEEENEDIDLIFLLENLRNYQQNPLDINKASYEELKELRLLNDIQINDLIWHINAFGALIALEELQSIKSFDLEDIKRISSFITVSGGTRFQKPIHEMVLEADHELFLKWARVLETQKGYRSENNEQANYLGDPNNLFVRYRGSYENRFRMGFIMEKDAGEPFRTLSDNVGFDYLTFHVHLKDYSKFVKDVIIGDYTVSMGQGLISQADFAAGKSALVNNVARGGRFARAYNSVSENNYYRGMASTVQLIEGVEFSSFISKSKRDGNVQLDTLENGDENSFVSSLQLSGNHRTNSEIEDRHSLGLTAFGGSLKLKKRTFHVGLNAMHHSFDRPILRSEQAYNLFRFQGDKLTNVSVDFNVRKRNFNFFGENAFSIDGGRATLLGSLISMDRNVNLTVVYRDYERDYNAIYPNAFGESSTVNNERGIYMGVYVGLNSNWSIRAYADFWKHPWLRFTSTGPAYGKEYLFRIDYYKKRSLLLYAQYIYESKINNVFDDLQKTQELGLQNRHRFRINLNHNASSQLELRTRLELSYFENPEKDSKGLLFFQDFIYKSINSPFSFTSRLALFDTDDFDSRIFAYENTILYEFSIPAYFSKGFRYYLNVRYNLNYSTTLEFRIARTHFVDRDVISSGNNQIDGDTRTELKAQVKFQF